MKYLLVFVTFWSLTSEPTGSWGYKEYDWNENLQVCRERATLKADAARQIQSKQYLNRLLNLRPSMNLVNYDHRCWSEKEWKEFIDARSKSLDGSEG
jgi:hypothetical protein